MSDEEEATLVVVPVRRCFVCNGPPKHVVIIRSDDSAHSKSACDDHLDQVVEQADEMLKAFGLEPDPESTDPNPTLN